MTTKQIIGTIFTAIIVVFAIAWLVQGNDFFMYKVFAPKYEQVRRETFEQTKSYNQGMIQELQNMQFEYVKADSAHKQALVSIILHRVADYDENKLPPDLRSFIIEIRGIKTNPSYNSTTSEIRR